MSQNLATKFSGFNSTKHSLANSKEYFLFHFFEDLTGVTSLMKNQFPTLNRKHINDRKRDKSEYDAHYCFSKEDNSWEVGTFFYLSAKNAKPRLWLEVKVSWHPRKGSYSDLVSIGIYKKKDQPVKEFLKVGLDVKTFVDIYSNSQNVIKLADEIKAWLRTYPGCPKNLLKQL